MIAGLIIAFVINLPFYNWIFNKHWSWAEHFPLSWLGIGLTYMVTFFHEIGHTLAAWFYGYFTLPSFDFAHGGGMAWWFGDQQIMILITLWALMAYGLYWFRESPLIQLFLIILFLFNIATAFNEDWRMNVIDFMGPAFVPLVAGFFLIRALFDLAPRGDLERLLNAVFGFGMIFNVFVEAYGLLNSRAYRLVYYEQKGQHGFGDFDKISDRLDLSNFDEIVLVWVGLGVLGLIIPFVVSFLLPRN